MENKARRAPRSDDDLESATAGRMSEGNKNHYTWSRGEKQLLLVAIIVLLYHFNVFNFFHGQNIEEEDEKSLYLTGISSNIMANELLDTVGQNWVPVTDRDTLRCTNLDSLIKFPNFITWRFQRLGNVRDDEKQKWEDLGCEGRLTDMYRKWEESNRQVKQHCDKWKDEYSIDVGYDWGFATEAITTKWKQFKCDCHYPAGWKDDCLYGLPPTVHESTTPAGIDAAANARPLSERLSSPSSSQGLPVIAIVLGTTSRGYRWEELTDSPLIRIFLSSLARSLDAGFEYRVYAGFDVGDLFYDDDAKLAELQAWFKQTVAAVAEEKGIVVQLAFLRFLNILRKPGPIFNFLTASAYMDGADYLYRINDDTEFRTPWAGAMVTALSQFSPPYLGVVGPVCHEGNQNILTHDFVHRTHRYIFQTYYPVVLSDWWMDDWISKVYPRENTLRHPTVTVSHHTWMTGGGDPVRYQVDPSHESFLNDELQRGLRVIGAFQEKHCRNGRCAEPDGHVTPVWGGTYDDSKQTVFDSLFDAPGTSFESVWSNSSDQDGGSTGADGEDENWDDIMDYNYDYVWSDGEDTGVQNGAESDWELEGNATVESPWADEKPDDEWVSMPLGRGPGNSELHKDIEGVGLFGNSADQKKTKSKDKGIALSGGEGLKEETEDKVTNALRHQIKKLEDLAKDAAHNVFVPRGRGEEANVEDKDEDLLKKINQMEQDILKLKEEYAQRLEHREKERRHDIEKVFDNTHSVGPLTSSQIQRAAVLSRAADHDDDDDGASPALEASSKPRHPVLSNKAAKLVRFFAKSRKKQRSRKRRDRDHVAPKKKKSHDELREAALLGMMQEEAMAKQAANVQNSKHDAAFPSSVGGDQGWVLNGEQEPDVVAGGGWGV